MSSTTHISTTYIYNQVHALAEQTFIPRLSFFMVWFTWILLFQKHLIEIISTALLWSHTWEIKPFIILCKVYLLIQLGCEIHFPLWMHFWLSTFQTLTRLSLRSTTQQITVATTSPNFSKSLRPWPPFYGQVLSRHQILETYLPKLWRGKSFFYELPLHRAGRDEQWKL